MSVGMKKAKNLTGRNIKNSVIFQTTGIVKNKPDNPPRRLRGHNGGKTKMSCSHYPKNLWTSDDVKDMVNDWLADHEEITDLVIYGEPYYEPDIWQPDGDPNCEHGCWQQDVHDDKCLYTLVAYDDGNMEIYS